MHPLITRSRPAQARDSDVLAATLGYRPRRIETPRHMIRPDEIVEYSQRASGTHETGCSAAG